MYCSKTKVIMFCFCCFVMAACVTRKDADKPSPNPLIPSAAEVLEAWQGSEKIAAPDMKAELAFQPFSVGHSKGLLLAADIGEAADYIAYKACPNKKQASTPCVSGKTASLTEVLFNIPAGDYRMTYQACVQEARAKGAACGAEKTGFFALAPSAADRTTELLQELTHTSQEIKAQALVFRKTLLTYQKERRAQATTSSIDQLVNNQLQMSPYKLAALYDSEYYDATKQIADNQAKASPANDEQEVGLQLANGDLIFTGSTLVGLGSLAVASGLWGVYAHKNDTIKNRVFGGVKNAANDGFLNLRQLWSPSPKLQEEIEINALKKEANGYYKDFMGFTKKSAGKSSYQTLAVAGAIAVVTGIIVTAISSLNLADSQDATAHLLADAARLEAHIDSLKRKQARLVDEITALQAKAL